MGPGVPAIALFVSYDGSSFSGFARQTSGVATVQDAIEGALATVLRREVETVGAGRTDAGVHALGQVVSFPANGGEPELATIVRSLNGLTGPDVVITGARFARPGFSARFDARAREYRYRIVSGSTPPLFLRDVSWWTKSTLDVEAMQASSAHLIGEHDFRSFCVSESAKGKTTVRTLNAIEISADVEMGESCVVVRVTGNAFLHSMVRVIVGTLVEVGSGRRDPGWVAEVLAAHDRGFAGQTAPAQGLTLWSVDYPDDCWL